MTNRVKWNKNDGESSRGKSSFDEASFLFFVSSIQANIRSTWVSILEKRTLVVLRTRKEPRVVTGVDIERRDPSYLPCSLAFWPSAFIFSMDTYTYITIVYTYITYLCILNINIYIYTEIRVYLRNAILEPVLASISQQIFAGLFESLFFSFLLHPAEPLNAAAIPLLKGK